MDIIFFSAFLNSIVFFISIYIIHLVRKDLTFPPHALSKYALGAYGWVLSLGLYAIGIAQILLSVGLSQIYGFSTGTNLLICAGVATFFISFYKMEYPNQTYRGRLHTLAAGVQFTAFPLALMFLSQSFIGTIYFYITLGVAAGNMFFLALIFSYFLKGTTHSFQYFGIVQKTNIMLMTAWVAVMSYLHMLQ